MITVRVVDIPRVLPPLEAMDAMAMVMEEYAIAHALVLIHGEKRGAERYMEAGGHVRFDDEGEPVLLWDPTS